ncbi:DNA helicase II [Methylobacter sp. S3L5C]|uniref:DNA helicase II n=1 Tax=Methylobacter sp. S3L5C TaxID=2839024 RepID=UPI001FABD9F3|nr:DNA helicase II [Methylobacter sp. S3L5C]UOA08816.1 DNA helicase II [Methylobacter sp. S3L5C]
MDITKIIDPLNDAQRQAVTAPSQAMLILAGAGSGKTRVLVHRIAWQIQVEGVSAQAILAVTFTNKAAREMRGRIEELLKISANTLWIGTFHGIAHRLLRRHAKEAKLPETFQIMDSGDQLRVIKRLLNTLNFDDSKWPPREVQWFINAQKDEGIRARYMVETGDMQQRQMLGVYRAYEELCDRSGLVDFAELLLRAHELLRDNQHLLDFYQQRFRHVHVDEFQDTNTIQYAWLRLLTDGMDNLFVVGDDDQSIYGWRGAKIENIYSFQKHYPNHQVIKLEQNYRSTGTILKAANQIIANNAGRMGKELWTNAGDGDLISLYTAFNEQDEAYFVVERIRAWINEGGLRSDAAILYRSNAQSRQFEEKLMATGTPYRVYGGLRFFDRAEIKNALAYLRLMSNRHDDASFERVINTPTRGIGAKAIDDIRSIARDQTLSLWAAAIVLINERAMTARATNALIGFLELIKLLTKETDGLELYEKVKLVVEKCGLIELYNKEKMDKGEEKIENLEELVNAARLFDFDQENQENMGELDMFLSHAALESGDSQGDDFDDCVQLMTIHSAKGLEFKLVFLVGMEEGLFPSQQSVDDVVRLEEERRLCYVGITRAMQQLYLTYAESRRLYGRETYPGPSRFLREIPSEFLQEVRLRATISRPVTAVKPKALSLQATGSYKLGQRVGHAKFGEGTVLQLEGSGAQEMVQINFKEVGVKWLMLAYAKLDVL